MRPLPTTRSDTLLLRGVSHVITCDDRGREHRDADILVRGNRIARIGHGIEAPPGARVVDGRGLIATPGLVNAHQHLYQVALRALPGLERSTINPWLRGVTFRCLSWWRDGVLDPETVAAVARAGMVESLLGGVTTVADQHYFHPGGWTRPYIEHTAEAAREVGLRFHAGRGSITLGRAQGGAAPDIVTQRVDEVLRHSAELIHWYHDPDPLAMTRVDLAPCGVHVDAPELFEAFVDLADDHPGVGLHTHLYEHVDTEFCPRHYGITPWEFLGRHRWHDPRVWLAHVVDPPDHEIPAFAEAGVGVVHLPAPDLLMGWGTAPLRRMLDAGVRVGFGTTGAASNHGANVLADLRLAALAHRSSDPDPLVWPTVRELLRMATRGSAACLGRPTLGILAAGMGADIACWDLRTVDRVGIHDPVGGLVLTGLSQRADTVVVDGRVVVADGRCVTADENDVAAEARRRIGRPAL